jgi:3-dehydroquinate synthase
MILDLNDDFSQLNSYLAAEKYSKIFILVDENTHEYCLPILLGNLETTLEFEIIEIEAGEDLKNIETATHLWEILAEFQADRKAILLNLGGGVVTDLGGFVASTYKRGIHFVNIPTSLLGMCDASIGGKTGIDHGFLKNIIGTFAQPTHTFIYPPFLKTLPFPELRSGFAEMLKHGLIADKEHWNNLISIVNLTPDSVFPYITASMKIKDKVVREDFTEQNVRKILNFGHTVGHAIESLFLQKGNAIPHGEAVAIGMICETHLSFLSGLIAENTADQIIKEIRKFYPYHSIDSFSMADILEIIKNDKKNSGEKINFSLLDDIGSGIYDCNIPENTIVSALHYYQQLT